MGTRERPWVMCDKVWGGSCDKRLSSWRIRLQGRNWCHVPHWGTWCRQVGGIQRKPLQAPAVLQRPHSRQSIDSRNFWGLCSELLQAYFGVASSAIPHPWHHSLNDVWNTQQWARPWLGTGSVGWTLDVSHPGRACRRGGVARRTGRSGTERQRVCPSSLCVFVIRTLTQHQLPARWGREWLHLNPSSQPPSLLVS